MSEFILPEPKELVEPISEAECISLANGTGLDPADGETSAEAVQNRLMPLINQVTDYIKTGNMVLFANEESKCKEDDENPTIASILSRIYRVSEALACIISTYDPSYSSLIAGGLYPQVLMGKVTEDGNPVWATPDSTPTANSNKPVTSDGVYKAIRDTIMSVWHLWDEGDNGVFQYYVLDATELPDSGNTDGDYALVFDESTLANSIYTWDEDDDEWKLEKTIAQADMVDLSVAHIMKGTYADKDIYWFANGWNLLDADITFLENRIQNLEQKMEYSVQSFSNTPKYKIGVVTTYAEATAVPIETGVAKIVFIAGV